MFNKNNWREPIYKQDLIGVILNGFLAAILGGILGGCLDYLFGVVWNFPLSFSLIILVFFVSWRIKKGFYSYHILYPVLSILFLIIGVWFSCFSFYVVAYIALGHYEIYKILALDTFWLYFVESPVSLLISGIKAKNVAYIIMGIVDAIIYLWAFWFTYRTVKGRN